jgi:hypothetical protein
VKFEFGCHGLAPWSLTLAATEKPAQLSKMPRPRAVESHARSYRKTRTTLQDATASRRGVSRSQLQRKPHNSLRCHGLAPWSFTLAATKKAAQLSKMPRGVSRSRYKNPHNSLRRHGLDSALGSHPCVSLSSYQAPPYCEAARAQTGFIPSRSQHAHRQTP